MKKLKWVPGIALALFSVCSLAHENSEITGVWNCDYHNERIKIESVTLYNINGQFISYGVTTFNIDDTIPLKFKVYLNGSWKLENDEIIGNNYVYNFESINSQSEKWLPIIESEMYGEAGLSSGRYKILELTTDHMKTESQDGELELCTRHL